MLYIQYKIDVVIDKDEIFFRALMANTPLFYYIRTNSEDTCDKIKLNKASSVGLLLTLDDKSYLNYLCVTWFYYVEKKQAQDGYKALLTWEWTARPMNLNSAELLLNWPLCVGTPDGKCLFLSLSAMKTWALSPNTVPWKLRCVLDCCCYLYIQTLMPHWHSYIACTFICMQSKGKAVQSFSLLPNVYPVNQAIVM